MKFIHLTDTHLVPGGRSLHGLDPQQRLRACVAHIALHHSDAQFCVLTGDVADAGEPGAYVAAYDALADLPMPVHVIPGNHDNREALAAAFPSAPRDPQGFMQQVVRHPVGNFVLMDTLEPAQGSGGAYCAQRLEWLAAQLAAARGAPVYLFMHHPPFPVGMPSLDCIAIAEPEALAAAIVAAGNVRHIFFGHAHRPISGQWQGISFSTLFGTSHQTLLDLTSPEYLAYTAEPPAYGVVLASDTQVVVHTCYFLEDMADIKTGGRG